MKQTNAPTPRRAPGHKLHPENTGGPRQAPAVGGMQQPLPAFAEVDHAQVVGATNEERARAFAEANPWVLDELERLAVMLVDRGHRRISIRMLIGRMRFDWHLGSTVGDKWRFNDHHTPTLARMLIERRPELADAIELRRTDAEKRAELFGVGA